MTLAAFLLGLFLGVVAGILLWPFLVFWRSGAEPEPIHPYQRILRAPEWREPYDGEAIGV